MFLTPLTAWQFLVDLTGQNVPKLFGVLVDVYKTDMTDEVPQIQLVHCEMCRIWGRDLDGSLFAGDFEGHWPFCPKARG
jgi:hypothetical protein